MLKFIWFIVLISVNCIAINCDEESKSSDTEKSDLSGLSRNAEPEKLVINAKIAETDDEATVNEKTAPEKVVEEKQDSISFTEEAVENRQEDSGEGINDRKSDKAVSDETVENRQEDAGEGINGRKADEDVSDEMVEDRKNESESHDEVIRGRRKETVASDEVLEEKQESATGSHNLIESKQETVTPKEVVEDRRSDADIQESRIGQDVAEVLQDESKSSDHTEIVSGERSEISKSDTDTKERKADDILEARAEKFFKDFEKASSQINESERSSESETEEIEQKSDDLSHDKSLVNTRRMLSNPDKIVSYTMERSGDILAGSIPKVKISHKENNDEFESRRNIKFIDTGLQSTGINGKSLVFTPSPIAIQTTTPVIVTIASHEILSQPNLPSFHPRPSLNLNFPNVHAQFQGPFDLPFFLKLDQVQKRNHFSGEPNPQLTSYEENKRVLNSGYHHQYIQHPGHMISQNKQFDTFSIDTRNQVPQSHENPGNRRFQMAPDHNYIPNSNQNLMNQENQYHYKLGLPTAVKPIYQRYDLYEPRNQMEGINTKMSTCTVCNVNRNNHGNQIQLFHQPQGLNMNTKQYQVVIPNPFEQSIITQDINKHGALDKTYETASNNFRLLYQKLADATGYPRKY